MTIATAPTPTITATIDIPAALRRYRDQGLFFRAFTFGRHLLCPMRAIAERVPASGRILDIGCGHGLFTNLLAAGSSAREVVGVDPSKEKIAVATRSSEDLSNLRYECGLAQQINDGPYDAITILDVLYLLPDELKLSLLKHCRSLIAHNGVLLLKTNDTRPRWKYGVVLIEEFIMVKLIAFTLGGELHFRSIPQYTALLKQAGFSCEVHKIDGPRPVPHRLYVCRPL